MKNLETDDLHFDLSIHEINIDKSFVMAKYSNHYYRAACLQRLGCAEFALTDLDLAQDNGYQESNMFKLWDRRGQCLMTLRRFKEAKIAFEEALNSVKVAKLDKKKREKFLKDISNSFEKIANEENTEQQNIKPNDLDHEIMKIGKAIIRRC